MTDKITRLMLTVTRTDGRKETYAADGIYYGEKNLVISEGGRNAAIHIDDITLFGGYIGHIDRFRTIKEAREAAGLSRAALACRLGIPKRTIENWDSGKSSPPEWVKRLLIEKITTL